MLPNQITENKMQFNGHFAAEHQVFLPENISIQDLEKYEAWVHVAYKLRPFDKIECLTPDMTFWALLLVVKAEKGIGAKTKVIQYIDLTQDSAMAQSMPSLADGYRIKWNGGAKWCVIRLSDSVRISGGHESEQDAKLSLQNHLKEITQ
jgi:hypothetical protein